MTIQTFPNEVDYYKTPEGKAPFKDWLGTENRLILLLIGGDKGTQKRDIALAASYLQDHRRRQ